MEYNAWGDPKNPPHYDTELMFTRMLSGPMDFNARHPQPHGAVATRRSLRPWRGQLAYYVTIASPIQMAADLPENYEANPALPVHQGRGGRLGRHPMLDGAVGDYAVFARKDVGQPTWFMGGITDEKAATSTCPVLPRSGRPLPRGNLSRRRRRGLPHQPARDRDRAAQRHAADRMKLRMARVAGFAIRLVRLGR
jgi:alpha-glucosidase